MWPRSIPSASPSSMPAPSTPDDATPAPLFAAIAALGRGAPQNPLPVPIPTPMAAWRAWREQAVFSGDCVEILEAVPRPGNPESRAPGEHPAGMPLDRSHRATASFPASCSEYIGARRPSLSLGSLTGEAAAIVRDNRLGLASNDPAEIAAMLVRRRLDVKAKLGRLPDAAHGDRTTYSAAKPSSTRSTTSSAMCLCRRQGRPQASCSASTDGAAATMKLDGLKADWDSYAIGLAVFSISGISRR